MSARRHDLVYNSKFAWAKPLRQRGKDVFNKDIVAPWNCYKELWNIFQYIIRWLSITHVKVDRPSSYTFKKDPMSILVPKVLHNIPIDVYKL